METRTYPRAIIAAALMVMLAAVVYVALHIYDPVIRPIMDVLPPFVIAGVFALLLDPVVDWFQKMGRSRGFGVGVVGLSFLVVFLLVGFFVVPRITEQAVGLSENFQTYIDQAQKQLNVVLNHERPLLQRFHLPTTTADWAKRFSVQTEQAATRALSWIAGVMTLAAPRILWLIIIPLSTLWLLRDLDYIKAKIVHFTPDDHRERLMHVSSAVGEVFGKYVRGMLAVAILYSVVASVVLSVAGLDYALIIGGISGLLYLVPYIGTVAIALVTGIAAIVQPDQGTTYALVLMGILTFQSFVLFDLLITPRVVGGSVGVHPVLSLFSLALGARMFGAVGMVLAVPVAAALQVALGHWFPKINDSLRQSRPKMHRNDKADEKPNPDKPAAPADS